MVIRPKLRTEQKKSNHDEIVGKLLKPIWLVNDSLLEHKWVIKLHGTEMTFDFDKTITPWPEVKSLLHSDFQADLITAKLLLFYSLKPKPLGWNASVTSLEHTLRSYVYFVRWRAECGLRCNSLLAPEWFDEFDKAFKAGGRENLLPLSSRAIKVFQAFDRGQLKFELNDRKAIAARHFSRLLGLNDFRSFPTKSRQVIISLLNERKLQVSRDQPRERLDLDTPEAIKNKPAKDDNTEDFDDETLEAEGKMTAPAARIYYKVWLDLWKLRDKLLHDVIGYRAFTNNRALSHHVSKGGFPEPDRTADSPAYQTSYLINSALSLILDPLSGQFVEIVEGLAKSKPVWDLAHIEKLNSRLVELGFPKLKPVYFEHRKVADDATLTIHDFVFKVLPACARIVIAAYSARRDEEIKKTKVDCIELDEHGDYWLRCLINKNMNTMDRIPVPRSVACAVDLVRRIRSLGNKTSDKLFDFACPVLKRAVKFVLGATLDKVRDFFGVPLLEDGNAWHFTPHQFRKFFGVTYYWRWAFPNLTALTLQYRHFNPDTTRAYIELKGAEALRMRDEKLAVAARQIDLERKNDFDSGQREFVSWVIKEVAEGKRLAGGMGTRINEMVDSLIETFSTEIDITITDSEGDSFDQALEQLIDSFSMATHPEGHSICCMGSRIDPMRHQQAVSQCLAVRQRVTGKAADTAFSADLRFAADTGCAACGLRARLPQMMPYWDTEMQKAKEALHFAEGQQKASIEERLRIIHELA